MARSFFEVVGVSREEVARDLTDNICQANVSSGSDGVRELVSEAIAKRLARPLHVWRPAPAILSASAKAFFKSATPENTALIAT